MAKKASFTLKGGKGSGHFGHAGRPGKVGGSARGDSQPLLFTANDWKSLSIMDRKDKWAKLPQHKRDVLANAGNSIRSRIDKSVDWAGERPNSGDVRADIEGRCKQLDEMSVAEDSKLIRKTVNDFDDVLKSAGLSDELRYKLTQEAIDTLYVQDNEALGRQLGDHGIHHINGNISATLSMLAEHPDVDTPAQYAMAYISGIFHDTGYITPPSHIFLDEGHQRWSAEHYNTHIRPLVEQAFGSRVSEEISHIIRTHDSTDIDWKEDIVGSAFRVSDNLALFHKEKLPAIFREVPENVDVLENFAAGKISLGDAQRAMIANIKKVGYNRYVENEMIRGVQEITDYTPKVTLGMLAGVIGAFKWTGTHMKVSLRRTPKFDSLNKLLDLGQAQFAKLAKSYRLDPKRFVDSLSAVFSDMRGNPLLELEVLDILKQLVFKFNL